MNKFFAVVLMVMLIAGPSAYLFADEGTTTPTSTGEYRLGVGQKAERGTKNLLFGWTELPKRVVDLTKETKNPIWGLLAGGFQGTLKAISRTASGAVDIITAPIDPDKPAFMQADMIE